MPYYKKTLLIAAASSIALTAFPAWAKVVTTKTTVEQTPVENTNKVNFSALDLNHDGTLSMSEVGQKLFYLFDTDGNEVIDNIEFKQRRVMTIIPMERNTLTLVDYDNDGQPEKSTYTYENFLEQSQLMRFDHNMDGLSPSEFIGQSFLKLDLNKSKVIELNEWKRAYTAMVHPKAADQERYNG